MSAPTVPFSGSGRRRTASWLAGGMVLLVAGALAFFFLRPGAAAPASAVPTATARKGEFLVIISCRGELVADKSVSITAPFNVPNLQIVWLAAQGAPVKAGDTIVRFDASAAERQWKEQQAALKQAQASLDQAIAEGRIKAEQDKLELASLQQAAEKARLEASKKEIVSAIQGEENRIDLGLAEEKVRVQQATVELNLASTRSNIASLESQRNKARDEAELTRSRLTKMELKTPAAGIVNLLMNQSQGWFNAKPFKVGDNVWPGVGIAEIPNLASLQLKGKAEEIDRGRMVVSQAARIVLDPFPEKTFLGRLESISPLAEATFEWPPSRTFRVMTSLGAPDERLRPGMNGRMDVIVDRIPDAISVPAKAVFAHDGRPVVLVPAKEGLRRVRVEVLARNPDEVAIRGIEAGSAVALVDVLTAAENKKSEGKGFEVKAR
jgi:multidrug efflux pump subunit AcrA (membrane-fusion protein)